MKKRYIYLVLALALAAFMAFAACTPAEQQGDGDSLNTNNPDATQLVKETDDATNPLSDTPLTLKAESVQVAAGETFSIFIELVGNDEYENWCSFEFAVNYDSTVFTIDEIVSTDLSKDMMSLSNLEYAKNVVKVGFASATDISEYGQIVELKCTAVAAGEVTVNISEEYVYCFVTESNGVGTTLPAALETESFTVTITE